MSASLVGSEMCIRDSFLLSFDPRGSPEDLPGSGTGAGSGGGSSSTGGATPSGRSRSAPTSSAPSPLTTASPSAALTSLGGGRTVSPL
eukprot:15467403-Alexandrium_andersonii.AAC.1